jgi:hypothetical protein
MRRDGLVDRDSFLEARGREGGVPFAAVLST